MAHPTAGLVQIAAHAARGVAMTGVLGLADLLGLASPRRRRRNPRPEVPASRREQRLLKTRDEALAAKAAAERRLAVQLEENQRLAQTNERLQRFTSIVAHDLRAPLRRVESFASLLREQHEQALDEDGRELLERIERGAARVRVMLTALLDYSRGAGPDLEDRTCDLARVVGDAIEDLGVGPVMAGVRVNLDGVGAVVGDAQLLGQVMQNLIGNALKFRRPGSRPSILIEGRRTPAGEVRLSVADDGIGVAPEHAEKVFDMFYRLHADEDYEGVGVGLSLCRKIMTDHGGRIWIDKTYRGGTRVMLTLLAAEPGKAARPTKPGQPAVPRMQVA